jgi:hypothetical protein
LTRARHAPKWSDALAVRKELFCIAVIDHIVSKLQAQPDESSEELTINRPNMSEMAEAPAPNNATMPVQPPSPTPPDAAAAHAPPPHGEQDTAMTDAVRKTNTIPSTPRCPSLNPDSEKKLQHAG